MPVTAARPEILSDETYPIQNEHKGPSTYTHGGPNSAEQYQWQGKGDPEGGDVQFLPGSVVKSPGFQRIMARGLFTFADSSIDHLAYQGEVWQDHQQKAQESVISQLEDDDATELEQVACKGPGKQGSGSPCGDTLFIRRKDLAEKPPLCERHQRFSKFFEKDAQGEWQRMAK